MGKTEKTVVIREVVFLDEDLWKQIKMEKESKNFIKIIRKIILVICQFK